MFNRVCLKGAYVLSLATVGILVIQQTYNASLVEVLYPSQLLNSITQVVTEPIRNVANHEGSILTQALGAPIETISQLNPVKLLTNTQESQKSSNQLLDLNILKVPSATTTQNDTDTIALLAIASGLLTQLRQFPQLLTKSETLNLINEITRNATDLIKVQTTFLPEIVKLLTPIAALTEVRVPPRRRLQQVYYPPTYVNNTYQGGPCENFPSEPYKIDYGEEGEGLGENEKRLLKLNIVGNQVLHTANTMKSILNLTVTPVYGLPKTIQNTFTTVHQEFISQIYADFKGYRNDLLRLQKLYMSNPNLVCQDLQNCNVFKQQQNHQACKPVNYDVFYNTSSLINELIDIVIYLSKELEYNVLYEESVARCAYTFPCSQVYLQQFQLYQDFAGLVNTLVDSSHVNFKKVDADDIMDKLSNLCQDLNDFNEKQIIVDKKSNDALVAARAYCDETLTYMQDHYNSNYFVLHAFTVAFDELKMLYDVLTKPIVITPKLQVYNRDQSRQITYTFDFNAADANGCILINDRITVCKPRESEENAIETTLSSAAQTIYISLTQEIADLLQNIKVDTPEILQLITADLYDVAKLKYIAKYNDIIQLNFITSLEKSLNQIKEKCKGFSVKDHPFFVFCDVTKDQVNAAQQVIEELSLLRNSIVNQGYQTVPASFIDNTANEALIAYCNIQKHVVFY